MADYLTNVNAQHLLSAWEGAGQITPKERGRLGELILSQRQEEDLPIYLRILVGVGACFASICILGFLSISKLIDFDSSPELFTWGFLLIGAAIGLARQAGKTSSELLHTFLIQVSFCAIGVGKVLAVSGATRATSGYTDDLWAATGMLALVTALAWPFYRMSLDRFVSAAAVFLMAQGAILGDDRLHGSKELLLNGLFAGQLLLAALIFTSGRVSRNVMPLGYALLVSLSSITGIYACNFKIGWGIHAEILSPALVNVSLAATLVGLIGWASGDLKRLATEPLLVASAGAVLLGIAAAPGVILSIGLMVLGYARHDRKLIGAGALLMPAFLWMYYYNLDLTLMEKSGVLVGSGLLLLAGRGYMAAHQLAKEIVP